MLFCITLIYVKQNIRTNVRYVCVPSGGGKMRMAVKFIFGLCFAVATIVRGAMADSLFFDNETVQNGINVVEMSKGFADIYEKLDGVQWGGKNINVAIESLENLNSNAHIAATDERVVLVWRDSIIANYPRPAPRDWHAFGEITTALVLKIRERDATLNAANMVEIYRAVVDSLMRGIDENGRYVYSKSDEILHDGRLLTIVGIEGAREQDGNFRVTGIYKGAPADMAGVSPGDLIVEINGVPVPQIDDATMASMMSGFNSGTLKLGLATPAGARRVVVRRATMVVADADIVFLDDNNGGIMEIIVNKVSDNAVAIIAEALNKHTNLSGIILDLRTASGDDERAAAKLAGLFLGARPVMRIVQTAGAELEVVPAGDALTGAPVVLIVSNTTRGTAEAIATAFYENGRGVLIGTPTAGNARIATQLDLQDGGMLEVMNNSIKTGKGRKIDGRGVFPVVCLSNIRTSGQQNAFFLNVVNNDFRARDFNAEPDVAPESVRRGCPTITSGTDEDAVSLSVAVKLLTDGTVYNRLLNISEGL